MDALEMMNFLGRLHTLQVVLKKRRGSKLNFLFGKNELNYLHECIKALNNFAYHGDVENYKRTVTTKLLDYLKGASRTEESFKENLGSLQSIRGILDGVGAFCAGGNFGKEGLEITVQAQKIIMWLREAENILVALKNKPQPD